MGQPVRLDLTSDEALVLFELLARFNDDEILSVKDQAEERALWNLHCLLQKQLWRFSTQITMHWLKQRGVACVIRWSNRRIRG